MEISPGAVTEAKKWVASEAEKGGKDASKAGHIDIVLGDFFDDSWITALDIETRGAFELVYDYAVGLHTSCCLSEF